MTGTINRGLAWLERQNFLSVHALMLYATMALTWLAFLKMSEYALASKLDGAGLALVIASITAPVTYLQKAVFEVYSGYRREVLK